jgi:hypothetical protein
VLLASIVVELSIERYLRCKELWDEYAGKTPENYNLSRREEQRRVSYADNSLCKRLNALRIEAAHMNTFPHEDLSPPNEMDEVEDVSVRTVDERRDYDNGSRKYRRARVNRPDGSGGQDSGIQTIWARSNHHRVTNNLVSQLY